VRKRFGVWSLEFGVNGKTTHCKLQIREFSWIDLKLKTQKSKLQYLKGAAA